MKDYKYFFNKKNYELSERKKGRNIKILNSTDNNKKKFLEN